MLFTKDDLIRGLRLLGIAAAAEGRVIDLAVYGGSCLMLVSNFRDASQDIDAVAATDQPFVDRLARTIAEAQGWPVDWLNDGVRVYLSPNVEAPDDHALTATFPDERTPGLRVYVPTAEYMLAMKLMALRIDAVEGGKDKRDIDNLIAIIGIKTRQDLVAIAAHYYPEAKVSSKLLMSAERLIADAAKETMGEAPRYLDRRRGGKPAG